VLPLVHMGPFLQPGDFRRRRQPSVPFRRKGGGHRMKASSLAQEFPLRTGTKCEAVIFRALTRVTGGTGPFGSVVGRRGRAVSVRVRVCRKTVWM
jgi:hypothetical protein